MRMRPPEGMTNVWYRGMRADTAEGVHVLSTEMSLLRAAGWQYVDERPAILMRPSWEPPEAPPVPILAPQLASGIRAELSPNPMQDELTEDTDGNQ